MRPRRSEVKPPLVRAKVKTIFQRGEAPEILELETEANLDPLEILKAAGVGILVGGVTLAAGWLLWDGLAAPTPLGPVQVFRGVKESAFWREKADKAQKIVGEVIDEKLVENARCRELQDQLDRSRRLLAEETNIRFREVIQRNIEAILARMKGEGCDIR